MYLYTQEPEHGPPEGGDRHKGRWEARAEVAHDRTVGLTTTPRPSPIGPDEG